MRLFWNNGILYAETGEEIEGVMVEDVEEVDGLATVKITFLLEHAPELEESVVENAISGLTGILSTG